MVHLTLYLYKTAHLEIYIYIKDILKHFHLEKETAHLSDIFDQTVFDIHRMTFCIENYFSLNKMLLLTVGLWPYHQKKLLEFQIFFFIAILTSYILAQVCLNLIILLYNGLK